MKIIQSFFLLTLLFSINAVAAESIYKIRVDGLACPYCAYGIEKKMNEMDGVKFLDMDLDKGIVTAKTKDGITLQEQTMTQLFQDAGFTFRNMTKTE